MTDWILNTFGCPSETVLLLTSFVCPFLPLIILALTRKSIKVPQNEFGNENNIGKLLASILVILYVVYAFYAFMVPQALLGECGYAH